MYATIFMYCCPSPSRMFITLTTSSILFLSLVHSYLYRITFFFFFLMIRPPPSSPLFPYTTLFRSEGEVELVLRLEALLLVLGEHRVSDRECVLRGQHVIDRRVGDVAVAPQLGPLARHDVQVRSIQIGRAHV